MSSAPQVVLENEYHKVIVKMLTDSRDLQSLGYAVLNKRTNVVEHEGFNLIECDMFVKGMLKPLQEFYEEGPTEKSGFASGSLN